MHVLLHEMQTLYSRALTLLIPLSIHEDALLLINVHILPPETSTQGTGRLRYTRFSATLATFNMLN